MFSTAPRRPIEHAEESLIHRILDGTFLPGDTLPAERELAAQLGVTRPTLREALRYLERDGWLTIRQGKSTVVSDYWRDGNMNIITTLVRHGGALPPSFIPNLLQVRIDLAPSYFEAAVAGRPAEVSSLFAARPPADAPAASFAAYDWQMHREMAILSGNPIYTLILNGFGGFYETLARTYFAVDEARETSHAFYRTMGEIIAGSALPQVRPLVEKVMRLSRDLWHRRHTADS